MKKFINIRNQIQKYTKLTNGQIYFAGFGILFFLGFTLLNYVLGLQQTTRKYTTTIQAAEGSAAAFLDFSGVNHGDASDNTLYGSVLSWNRIGFIWDAYEPVQGQYDEAYLQQYAQDILTMKWQGVNLLPMFGYNTTWSSEDPNSNMSPLAAEHVADWERMVDRVVKFLRAPPYNVEYFQVWNEAHPNSGFWTGSMDTYMQRVHLPAAQAIRANGGKVVYGGWPAVAPLQEYISLLDQHNAWSTLDVLAMHYFPGTVDFQTLYDAAVSRGFPDMGIWQTEFGFDTDSAYIGDAYPRYLSWAVQHNWSYPHKYKLFWFPHWSPNDPQAYAYQKALYSGDTLSPHGLSLQTLASLFDRPGLGAHAVTVSAGEAEGFAMDGRLVVAVHISPSQAGSVTLTLPQPSGSVTKVERVDLANVRQDITSNMTTSGQNLVINVSTTDSSGSPAYTWNQGNVWSTPTFYVALETGTGIQPWLIPLSQGDLNVVSCQG